MIALLLWSKLALVKTKDATWSFGAMASLPAVPPIKTLVGQWRRHPAKLHVEKGYDDRTYRRALRRHIRVRIARNGIKSSERLGRHRWVVERTFAWCNYFRRLRIQYERRADIHRAFLTLSCALVC